MEYQEFLKSKIKISEEFGFTVKIEEINPKLKPHNKLMVKWLVEGANVPVSHLSDYIRLLHSWRR